MGRRVVSIAVVAGVLLVGVGLFVPWVVRGRADQDRVYATNNQRELARFAAAYAEAVAAKKPNTAVLAAVPAGTLFHPGLPAEKRLSWVPSVLPLFDQRRQPTADLVKAVDPQQPWDAPPHAILRETRLAVLICPAAPTAAAVTHVVGIAGLGADAAELPAGPPPHPRAGAFRYDSPTPFETISAYDGLSQTLLFAESAADPGPWCRGGVSTVRGVTDAEPQIGRGGQFGGFHAGGAVVTMADGSTKFLTNRMNGAVFRALATAAGGPAELTPDD